MDTSKYDVAIIGAGPAGSCAAYRLARRGYSVIVIEHCKLPRYKSCSGMIIAYAVQFIRNVYGLEIPTSVMCRPEVNKGMYFIDCDGKELCFTQTGCNVWRNLFDNWLTGLAQGAGAVVKDYATLIDYVSNSDGVDISISSSLGVERACARYLIDCSGATGRQRVGLSDYIYTYQIYNEGTIDCDKRYFYAFLQPELSEYDAWFNIKDCYIVIGVAVKAGAGASEKCREYYAKFISYLKRNYSLNIMRECKVDKWVMTQVHSGCDIDYGDSRVLNAGERAGFLNPMGEGVSCALKSGICCADAIADNFDSPNDAIRQYVDSVKDIKAYMSRQWDLAGRMARTFSHMRLNNF